VFAGSKAFIMELTNYSVSEGALPGQTMTELMDSHCNRLLTLDLLASPWLEIIKVLSQICSPIVALYSPTISYNSSFIYTLELTLKIMSFCFLEST